MPDAVEVQGVDNSKDRTVEKPKPDASADTDDRIENKKLDYQQPREAHEFEDKKHVHKEKIAANSVNERQERFKALKARAVRLNPRINTSIWRLPD